MLNSCSLIDEGSSGIYGAFASKLGSGAASVGKRVAQSEAGRSATRAAVKGATDAAVKDVSNRYLGGEGGDPAPPPQTKPSQQKSISSPAPTQTRPSSTTRYHDDSDDEFEEYQQKSKAQNLPPKPSVFKRFKPNIKLSGKSKEIDRPHRTRPREKIYKYALSKEADWAQLPKAVALHNFKGEMKCDLEFCKGQWIDVITRTENQFDWWEGRINDRVGIFPANYVKVV